MSSLSGFGVNVAFDVSAGFLSAGRGGGAAGRGGGRRTRVIQSSCRATSRIMHARHPVGSTARAERLIWAPTVRDSAFSVQMAGGFAQPGSRRCGRGRAMRSLPPLGAPTPHPSCVFDGFAHLGSGTLSTGRVPAGGGGCVSCGSAPRCAQPQGCSGKRCRAVKNATAVGARGVRIRDATGAKPATLRSKASNVGHISASVEPGAGAGRRGPCQASHEGSRGGGACLTRNAERA